MLMRRIAVLFIVMLTTAAVPATATPTAAGTSGHHPRFPTSIPLPNGFFPEGITIDGRTAYVGSLIDGAIQEQDLRTGGTRQFAASPGTGRIAVGMDVDRTGRLWVAGGGPALAPGVRPGFRVYDTRTGRLLLDQEVNGGFVNDVIVTRDAAWFTDSFLPRLIRVPIGRHGAIGAAEYVPLEGDWKQVTGEFNANGIVATADGRYLIVAQSTAPVGPGAALYRVPADADGSAVDAVRIAVDGTLAGADGLVLVGRTLYSVAGPSGVVKLRLSSALSRGRIVATLPVPGGVTPTTADVFGRRLYVVDAKFPLFGDPAVAFQTTAIRR
jgi:sugar lactone lactonase YvrE